MKYEITELHKKEIIVELEKLSCEKVTGTIPPFDSLETTEIEMVIEEVFDLQPCVAEGMFVDLPLRTGKVNVDEFWSHIQQKLNEE